MMRNKNILVQEEEFLKLNAEIDSKTEDLMNQVEQIKEIQLNNEKLYSDWKSSELPTQVELFEGEKEETRFFGSDSGNSLKEVFKLGEEPPKETDLKKDRRGLKLSHSAKISTSVVGPLEQDSALALGITRHKSDVKLKNGKVENDVIPETLKGVGSDGLMRFLSAKVKLLSEQLEIMQKDEKKHLEKIKELQAHKDKSIEERDKLLHQGNLARNVLIKYEKQVANLSAQLQSAQVENSNLKKELEILKKDLRQGNKNHSANEIKLNRTLEEVEKLKGSFQQMKQEDKELKELHRKKTEELSNTIKTLDRQRVELLNGFKKQLTMIDNLKRQRGLMEAGKLLKATEDDFMSFLDCNPPKTGRRTEVETFDIK